MFPSFLTRAAGAALELAEAMLAPLPEDGGDGDGVPPALEPPRSQKTQPAHPHRRPLRPRTAAADARRPGGLARAQQACTTPLPLARPSAAPRVSAQLRP